MSRVVVLDADALSHLANPKSPRATVVRAALEAARRLHKEVLVPAVVLAELHRSPAHNQMVDAYLSRDTGLVIRPTDRPLARLVGGVLAAADAGSDDIVDAHNVATAIEEGGGVVLTGDPSDHERLAAPYPHVTIASI